MNKEDKLINYECERQISMFEYLHEKQEQVEYDDFSKYMNKPEEDRDE